MGGYYAIVFLLLLNSSSSLNSLCVLDAIFLKLFDFLRPLLLIERFGDLIGDLFGDLDGEFVGDLFGELES